MMHVEIVSMVKSQNVLDSTINFGKVRFGLSVGNGTFLSLSVEIEGKGN